MQAKEIELSPKSDAVRYYHKTYEVSWVNEKRRKKFAPNSNRAPFVFLSVVGGSVLSQLFHAAGENVEGVFGEKHFSTGVVGNGNNNKEFGNDVLV